MTRLPPGAAAALLAALLFGASTPLAKRLLGELPPVLLAGLLYLGSGVGLAILRALRRLRAGETAPLTSRDVPWLAGAILFGGVLGPVLLMAGLESTPASAAALLLNLEGVPYIDSAGLGEIVRTYTTVSRQGGKLKLLNLTKRIQDLLSITKLLTVFETYEEEAEAIKSFA